MTVVYKIHILLCQREKSALHNNTSAYQLKIKLSSGHAIALWKKLCGIDQKRLIM